MANLDSSISNISPAKSIFASKTIWGAVFTAVAAVAPTIGEAVDNRQITGREVAEIVVILSGTAATVVGRAQAEAAIYTPHGMLGPNREDLPTSSNVTKMSAKAR